MLVWSPDLYLSHRTGGRVPERCRRRRSPPVGPAKLPKEGFMSMHAARRVALVAALACAALTAAPAHASAPAWTTPVTLSSQGSVKVSAIAAGPDGQALAVFQDPQGLRAAFPAPGGDWGPAETVTADPASADRQLSDAVFLPDGRALVA